MPNSSPRDRLTDLAFLQYRIVEKLGEGGMGEIYKARDTRLNRFVAIKVLPAGMSADPDRRRRFIQEAQAASALNHPNIITIYDIVSHDNVQYMVSEYIEGKTLVELIPKDGLRVPLAIRYAAQIADALSAAHAAGIVHRDLKPANVMVTSSGFVKLLDFGLAKFVDFDPLAPNDETKTLLSAAVTVEGALMGTVSYMSPEQAEGRKLDARSDVFSFGSLLYEMLTGRCAFHGSSPVATLSAVLRDDVRPIPESAPDVPTELEQMVMRCLKKDPAERFQSMQELQASLAPLRRHSESGALYNRAIPVAPPVAAAPSVVARKRKSNGAATGIAVLVVLLSAAGGGYLWSTRQRPVAMPPKTQASKTTDLTSTVSPFSNPGDAGTMSNSDVMEMAQAKVADSVIIGQIRSLKTEFNLSSGEVIRLSGAGVSAAVIAAMRDPKAAASDSKATAVVLTDGLPVRLILSADIPANAGEGDAVTFTVEKDVSVKDTVVIRKGAAATGSIVDGARKRVLGIIGGKMTFRLETVATADGNTMSLRATPLRPVDGASKHSVDDGAARKTKNVAAVAGAAYMGYIDGTRSLGDTSSAKR